MEKRRALTKERNAIFQSKGKSMGKQNNNNHTG
jgi:hypothetical protein